MTLFRKKRKLVVPLVAPKSGFSIKDKLLVTMLRSFMSKNELTYEEAHDLLGLSSGTVWGIIKRGQKPSVRTALRLGLFFKGDITYFINYWLTEEKKHVRAKRSR